MYLPSYLSFIHHSHKNQAALTISYLYCYQYQFCFGLDRVNVDEKSFVFVCIHTYLTVTLLACWERFCFRVIGIRVCTLHSYPVSKKVRCELRHIQNRL